MTILQSQLFPKILPQSAWLSTRTFPLSTTQKQRAKELQITIDFLDFITIDYTLSLEAKQILAHLDFNSRPHILLSSQNAVYALQQYFSSNFAPKLHFYCVGEQTLHLTKKYFPQSNSEYLGNNMNQSLPHILKMSQSLDTTLYFCAATKPLPTLINFLNHHAVKFQHIPLYTTKLQAHSVKNNYDGVLFYSPSGVQAFFTDNPNYLENPEKSPLYLCIGQTTANELQKKLPNIAIFCPEKPNRTQMINLILGLN